jgi:3-hydroxy-3-methylglutaryl CoA synthase
VLLSVDEYYFRCDYGIAVDDGLTVVQAAKSVCEALELDGVVVIGGDDSNTNAAVLAEYFESNGCRTKVMANDDGTVKQGDCDP